MNENNKKEFTVYNNFAKKGRAFDDLKKARESFNQQEKAHPGEKNTT